MEISSAQSAFLAVTRLSCLAAGSGPTGAEHLLSIVLIQLLVVMLAARVCAGICRSWGQPAVVGEIAAGLLLGPSCFGRLCPEVSGRLFDPAAREVFGVLGELGLIFLLFLVGLEFDLGQLRLRVRSAFAISLTGVVLPFALGVTLALAMRPLLKGESWGGRLKRWDLCCSWESPWRLRRFPYWPGCCLK